MPIPADPILAAAADRQLADWRAARAREDAELVAAFGIYAEAIEKTTAVEARRAGVASLERLYAHLGPAVRGEVGDRLRKLQASAALPANRQDAKADGDDLSPEALKKMTPIELTMYWRARMASKKS